MTGGCISNASWHKHTNPGRDCMYQDTHRNTHVSHRATLPKWYIRLQVKKKREREKRLSLEGKGERYVPRDFLTHLLSGWQSWQWVWEAGQGVAWEGTAASLGSPHGLQRKQQVFWGAVAGLVWLKDLGTGGLQTHWQRDSLQTLRGQPHDTQETLHKCSAGAADGSTQDRDVG